ncbi:hypothetical protein QQP08_016249, partial [Theobroma cacao]
MSGLCPSIPFLFVGIISGNLSYVLRYTSVATVMVDKAASETNEEMALWNTFLFVKNKIHPGILLVLRLMISLKYSQSLYNLLRIFMMNQDLSRSNFRIELDAANATWLLNDVFVLVGDVEGDVPLEKRLRRSSSDALQTMVGNEELSLYVFYPTNVSLPLCVLKTFLLAVRDSLINVGPLKDFSYGLRINADANATGIAKQSNYELVEPTGCKGIWTVYHKSTRSHSADLSEVTDDEYHAYLIISLEARTM